MSGALDPWSTKGKTITIEVSLSSTDPGAAFAEVRVEHHVKARPANFINGKTGYLTFELVNPPASHGRVGIWDLEWHWEYRQMPHQPWHHFATTRHRIYVVLDVPTAPWKQGLYNAGNTQLPWTDVLDYPCRWADGASSTDIRNDRHAVNGGDSLVRRAPSSAIPVLAIDSVQTVSSEFVLESDAHEAWRLNGNR